MTVYQDADVLEVLQAIAQAYGLHWDHVVATAATKHADRGAFNEGIFPGLRSKYFRSSGWGIRSEWRVRAEPLGLLA